jgi:hypothetical protein
VEAVNSRSKPDMDAPLTTVENQRLKKNFPKTRMRISVGVAKIATSNRF